MPLKRVSFDAIPRRAGVMLIDVPEGTDVDGLLQDYFNRRTATFDEQAMPPNVEIRGITWSSDDAELVIDYVEDVDEDEDS